MDASTARIGFIGFGNMAQAMAKGLVEHDIVFIILGLYFWYCVL